MQGFNGFPPGKTGFIEIPNLFFSELLPIIDNLAELKVTLYCFWALHRQEGERRYVRFSEVLLDELLMAQVDEATLRDGFERAVARGTLLAVKLPMLGQHETLYFMNTPLGRNAVKALEAGSWLPGDEKRPIQLIIERPNIFVLYEQNIGQITPMIADQLRAAEQEYPADWIEEAIRMAATSNKRNWRYIQTILDRWLTKGKRTHEVSEKHTSQYGDKEDDYSNLFG